MNEKLKKRYNKWLFKKYRFYRGLLFENIPLVFKICPLWSPSLYGYWEGKKFIEWFINGIEEGLKGKEDD